MVDILVVGSEKVGKSSLIGRIVGGFFAEVSEPTISPRSASRTMHINDNDVTITLWDMPKKELFRESIPPPCKTADAVILAYSIDDEESFGAVDSYFELVHEEIGPFVRLYLVGLKSDLGDQRKVSSNDGLMKAKLGLAEALKCSGITAEFFEISAKTGDGIEDVIVSIAREKCEQKVDGDTPEAPRLRVLLIGPEKVGKTSFVQRLVESEFPENPEPTTSPTTATMSAGYDEFARTLEFGDIPGTEEALEMTSEAAHEAEVIFLMYSITSEASFKGIDSWLEKVREGAEPSAKIYLIGLKSDLEAERQVAKADGEKKGQGLSIPFFEISAKTGYGIENLFEAIMEIKSEPKGDEEKSEPPKLNVLVVGPEKVGKTSFVQRLVASEFPENPEPTINASGGNASVGSDEFARTLDLLDVPGSEAAREIIPVIGEQAQVILLTYSITNEGSFKEVDSWLELVRNEANPSAKQYLVGLKSDLEGERQVSKEDGEKKGQGLSIPFFEISAKSESGLGELIEAIVKGSVSPGE
jgi:Ras-related protein Rab-5C